MAEQKSMQELLTRLRAEAAAKKKKCGAATEGDTLGPCTAKKEALIAFVNRRKGSSK